MEKPSVFSKIPKSFWFWGTLCLAAALVLNGAARLFPGFAWRYRAAVYPLIVDVVGGFSGLFPVSLSELGLYILILTALWKTLRHIRRPLKVLSGWYCLASGLLLLFTLNCGINYYSRPFSYYSGLEAAPSARKELVQLCTFLTEQVQESAARLEAEGREGGQTLDTSAPSFETLRKWGLEGRASMAALGETWPELSGFYPQPKALLWPRLLSIQQLCGIYSPFTVEANYNGEMPIYNIPHTICHELSHLKGFMREDEANFIGWLSCSQSEDSLFSYSGWLMGWIYAGNALASVDPETYMELYRQLPEMALQDLNWNSQFWNRYEGKVAEASTKINDTYLKMNSQTDGVRSYGRAVDLMLAYYRKNPYPQT